MRVVFIGAVSFSEKALRELIFLKVNIVAVCTLENSKFNSDHVDLTQLAKKAKILVRYTPKINQPEVLTWLSRLKPDFIFCFGWSQLLCAELLAIPKFGVVGFHPAALPANRGRHPIVWALVMGLSETASTFFFMDEGVDSGDILLQCPIKISMTDDAGTLYSRITEVAIKQLNDLIPRLESGVYERIPQNHSLSNVWRKRSESDGLIDWRMTAKSIFNLVRGLSYPYVGAHFFFLGRQIRVWRTSVEFNAQANIEPGKILDCDELMRPLIMTGQHTIRLLEWEPKITLKKGDYL